MNSNQSIAGTFPRGTVGYVALKLGVSYTRAHYLIKRYDEQAWTLANEYARRDLERRSRVAKIVNETRAIIGTQI